MCIRDRNKDEGERLSDSLESMGTTFIKLGQFLATRPDIIGEELSMKLENLQDRLPPFSLLQAKEIIKNDLGNESYNSIINLSEPVAAASIAQVHKAQINDNGVLKDVAIKILRPNIKKIFNEEIHAMILFAFLVESFIKKTKRLKLVEVVFLLKEITNLEMDLRFEAAAANEYAENTKNDVGFRVPQIYWNYTSENVMTLDWVDGVSIREKDKLIESGKNTSKIASDFQGKKILITGSNGKTIVKEWLNTCLKKVYNTCKSPKSYNSQVGVSLSVIGLKQEDEIGIFEAGFVEVGGVVIDFSRGSED